MSRKTRGLVVTTIVLLVTGACGIVDSSYTAPERSTSGQASAAERFQLRVSLYPWVPDASSLFQWVEADFESRHPDVDLVVRRLEKSYDWTPHYVADLAYETDKTVAALTGGGDDSQHLVEIDAMILGSLVERGAVAPFDVRNADFLPAAAEAVTWGGRKYGVPHWTCGYFVISENEAIRGAGNVRELLSTLAAAGTQRVGLVGDLDGSWDAVTVYLDGYRDTHPGGDLQSALKQDRLDPAVAASLQSVGEACTTGGHSRCGSDGVNAFATGSADALIGYSERLNPILAHTGKRVGDLHVASALFGSGDAPLMFTDALVMSPRCSDDRCRRAAQQFASYYVSDRVFEVLLMSLDVSGSAVPRYLLPSTTTAFGFGRVAGDRLYGELRAEIAGARSFPNHGIPEARERGVIRQQVRDALGIRY